MINYILLLSTIICSTLHICALWYYPRVPHSYSFILVQGMIISICNYGPMRYVTMPLSHITISRTIAMNLAYMEQSNTLIIVSPLMILAMAMYITSIHIHIHIMNIILRILSYVCLTMTHLIIIASFE